MKRWETVRLSCTKQMGSVRSSMRTTHPFRCPPEMHILRQFGGQSQCFFFSIVNSQSHPYKSMNKPNLSWSRARHVISYRRAHIGEVIRALHCPIVSINFQTFNFQLYGNAQYGIAYFLSTQINPYISKISFSKLIPLIQKILPLQF